MTDQVVEFDVAEAMDVFEPSRMLDELEAAWSPQEGLPGRVPLVSLEVVPELFQPRGMSEGHIGELARAIKANGELDAMLVLPIKDRLIIIDGHHRVEAYRRTATQEVPISYFEGSPKDAVFEAGRRNSKAKLPMVSRERQDFAWRLVLFGHGSKADVAGASGVSTSQVAAMRRVRESLGSEANSYLSWFRARAADKGAKESPADIDQWKEELADRWADGMAKQFSTRMANHPEVAAMALNTYFGRRLPELMVELQAFVDLESGHGLPYGDEDNPDF